ncbi:uncharacterized protein [Drosophila suzukii]|uniref:Uncharacterized protein n=1 Tax=Drosophila suzukii TaxID=28584 RepID=A0ABM4TY45_DROSZ
MLQSTTHSRSVATTTVPPPPLGQFTHTLLVLQIFNEYAFKTLCSTSHRNTALKRNTREARVSGHLILRRSWGKEGTGQEIRKRRRQIRVSGLNPDKFIIK